MDWDTICKRDQAFAKARDDLFNDTLTITDAKLLICIKHGTPLDLSDMCLTKLLAAYPA